MRVEIKINNLPDKIVRRYVVVRRCDDEDVVSLWYYGQYSSLHKANEVAVEIGNGFVVEAIDHDEANDPA